MICTKKIIVTNTNEMIQIVTNQNAEIAEKTSSAESGNNRDTICQIPQLVPRGRHSVPG